MAMRLILVVVVVIGVAGMGLLGVLALAPGAPPATVADAPAPQRRGPAGGRARGAGGHPAEARGPHRARDRLTPTCPRRAAGCARGTRRPHRRDGAPHPRPWRSRCASTVCCGPARTASSPRCWRRGCGAVTVGVDAVTGTAGLIWPGDRVDVILTQAFDENEIAPARRVAGEAVLTCGARHRRGPPPGAGHAARRRSATPSARPTAPSPSRSRRIRPTRGLPSRPVSAGFRSRLRAAGTPAEERIDQRPVWGGDVSGAFAPAGVGSATTAATGTRIRVFGGPGRVEEIPASDEHTHRPCRAMARPGDGAAGRGTPPRWRRPHRRPMARPRCRWSQSPPGLRVERMTLRGRHRAGAGALRPRGQPVRRRSTHRRDAPGQPHQRVRVRRGTGAHARSPPWMPPGCRWCSGR